MPLHVLGCTCATLMHSTSFWSCPDPSAFGAVVWVALWKRDLHKWYFKETSPAALFKFIKGFDLMWDPTNTIQHSVTVCRQCRSLDCCAVVMMGAAKSQSQIGFFANLQDVQFFFASLNIQWMIWYLGFQWQFYLWYLISICKCTHEGETMSDPSWFLLQSRQLGPEVLELLPSFSRAWIGSWLQPRVLPDLVVKGLHEWELWTGQSQLRKWFSFFQKCHHHPQTIFCPWGQGWIGFNQTAGLCRCQSLHSSSAWRRHWLLD